MLYNSPPRVFRFGDSSRGGFDRFWCRVDSGLLPLLFETFSCFLLLEATADSVEALLRFLGLLSEVSGNGLTILDESAVKSEFGSTWMRSWCCGGVFSPFFLCLDLFFRLFSLLDRVRTSVFKLSDGTGGSGGGGNGGGGGGWDAPDWVSSRCLRSLTCFFLLEFAWRWWIGSYVISVMAAQIVQERTLLWALSPFRLIHAGSWNFSYDDLLSQKDILFLSIHVVVPDCVLCVVCFRLRRLVSWNSEGLHHNFLDTNGEGIRTWFAARAFGDDSANPEVTLAWPWTLQMCPLYRKIETHIPSCWFKQMRHVPFASFITMAASPT